MYSSKTRRNFLKRLSGGVIAASTFPNLLAAPQQQETAWLVPTPTYSPNDKVRFAVIGMGIMGFNNTATALKVAGTELVAVCELYEGRLGRAKELYGKDIFTTPDYRAILERKDIDAVVVATTDHWHDHITIAALEAGKAVYCEKPMVHRIEEGAAVIAAEKRTGKLLQIGSQGVSSIVYENARAMYEAGEIGQLVMVETWNDRQSALGAWQYSIPRDASKKTVHWEDFLGDAPKTDFDPVRFFRWRNYRDYGTGVAGDLFVHLFSSLHVTISSEGPNRIFATGGLRYWKDGRDVPDVVLGLFDYPETAKHSAFNLQMRVNFIDGGGGGSKLRLVGTEGVMEITWNGIVVRQRKMASAPGYDGWDSFPTFTEKQQAAYKKWYDEEYANAKEENLKPQEKTYQAPQGYSADVVHHTNFFNALRTGGKVVEDGTFGLRACAPSLAANLSVFDQRVVHWDPVSMQLK